MTGPPNAVFDAGLTAHREGRLDAARRNYRRVVSEVPGGAWGWHLLGVLRVQAEGAGVVPKETGRALALDPMIAAVHLTLGDIAQRRGDRGGARQAFRRGVALVPGAVETQSLLAPFGDEPVHHRRRAAALAPGDGAIWCNLGEAELRATGAAKAETALRRSLVLSPDLAEGHANHAGLLLRAEKWAEGGIVARRALAAAALHAGALVNLATSLTRTGALVSVRRVCRQAIAAAPDLPFTLGEMAMTILSLGYASAAINWSRRALAIAPAPDIASNLIFSLCYVPGVTAADLLAEARRWAPRRVKAVQTWQTPGAEPITVGYLSPDLARHPVGYFLLPVLRHHDRRRFRSICYSTRRSHDEISSRLKAAASSWVDAAEFDEEILADRIAADGVGILVDLAGHTAASRLGVLSRRPAPVQATWAGFPGSTGTPGVDYIIADAIEIPVGAEGGYSERPVRLRSSYVCFEPAEYAPEPLPVDAGPGVAFGCFNNLAKLNEGVFRAWARVLAQVPESRLVLRWPSLMDPEVAEEVRRRLAACGVPPDAVDLGGCRDHGELLAAYRGIDIALDPFPYTGGLTTLEALWMGVPVVTLAGETFAGRHSASHLTTAGLSEWITSSVEAYVETAAAWAGRRADLAALRATLRDRLRETTLVDGAAFTRDLEAAYEAMWRDITGEPLIRATQP